MHRFTEPTSTSLRGHDLVEVVVAAWEIECCAPPPVLGESGTWTLQFAAEQCSRLPELHEERSWTVERRGEIIVLVDGGVEVLWGELNPRPPDPGAQSLRGYLVGTVHGPLPDDAPTVTGVVQRIRVLGQRFLIVERRLEPVPGTLELSDVTSSPRWFTSPIESGGERVHETGVLLDMAVPRPT